MQPIVSENDFAGATNIGQKRKTNDDNFLVADLHRLMDVCETSIENCDAETRTSANPGHLLMVADGMGGYRNGEFASRSAITHMSDYVMNLLKEYLVVDASNDLDFRKSLKDGVLDTQRCLQDEGRSDSDKSQMGTTLTMAFIVWPKMYVVHAGDSRCYLLRNNHLLQLTTDHTVAQALIDQGVPEDKVGGPSMHHMLYNSLSAATECVTPEVTAVDLRAGDDVLLCSDGLTRHLNDRELAEHLKAVSGAGAVCDNMIAEANRRGGKDNICVVVGRRLNAVDA